MVIIIYFLMLKLYGWALCIQAWVSTLVRQFASWEKSRLEALGGHHDITSSHSFTRRPWTAPGEHNLDHDLHKAVLDMCLTWFKCVSGSSTSARVFTDGQLHSSTLCNPLLCQDKVPGLCFLHLDLIRSYLPTPEHGALKSQESNLLDTVSSLYFCGY